MKLGLDPAAGAFNAPLMATIVVRAFNRSTAGTYTQIGSDHSCHRTRSAGGRASRMSSRASRSFLPAVLAPVSLVGSRP